MNWIKIRECTAQKIAGRLVCKLQYGDKQLRRQFLPSSGYWL